MGLERKRVVGQKLLHFRCQTAKICGKNDHEDGKKKKTTQKKLIIVTILLNLFTAHWAPAASSLAPLPFFDLGPLTRAAQPT